MRSGKLRKVGTLCYRLELAVFIASMHSHDNVEMVKIDN